MIPDIPKISFPQGSAFFLIAGPCVVEGRTITLDIASELCAITQELQIPFIYKASFKKANRSSIHSFTGIGDREALEVLAEVKQKLGVPIVTDVHSLEDVDLAVEYDIDVLQIPAFLSRQTDLLLKAAQTGKWVNVKKGQFMSPESTQFAVEKIRNVGNHHCMLTDRGTMFGYGDLIVDFRGIPVMQSNGCPVVLDVTHSLQQPNQSSGVTGGRPQMIETIAKAGVATGVDGLFFETHPNPSEAKSDGANMLPLSEMKRLLKKLLAIRMALLSEK